MNKFILFLSLVVYVECNGLGLIQAPMTSTLGNSGYGSYGGNGGYGGGYGIPAQLYQQPQQIYSQPEVVEVQNEDTPIKVIFRARSPKIEVQQIQEPSERGSVQRTRTDEEPHRLEHEIHRPVIQEIREVIQPYRRVIQEIQPVIEQVQTVVARGDGRANNNGGLGGLGGQALAGQVLGGQGLGGQEGLLLTAQPQYNTATLGDLQSQEYGQQLGNIGYQASRSPPWLNAKQLSRS